MIEREIPKEVKPPSTIQPEAVKLITELCFDPTNFIAGRCDAMIIFGTSSPLNHKEIAVIFPAVLSLYKPRVVYITGGNLSSGLTEAEMIYNEICTVHKHQPLEFRLDHKSTNTRENVTEAINLGLGDNSSIVFVTKAPHCGRCRLTLRKQLPNAKLKAFSYRPIFPSVGLPIGQNKWHFYPEIVRLMWGEFLRIERYGLRGDIEFPDAVRQKVEKIRSLTNT